METLGDIIDFSCFLARVEWRGSKSWHEQGLEVMFLDWLVAHSRARASVASYSRHMSKLQYLHIHMVLAYTFIHAHTVEKYRCHWS